jgi:hypothetical protein
MLLFCMLGAVHFTLRREICTVLAVLTDSRVVGLMLLQLHMWMHHRYCTTLPLV